MGFPELAISILQYTCQRCLIRNYLPVIELTADGKTCAVYILYTVFPKYPALSIQKSPGESGALISEYSLVYFILPITLMISSMRSSTSLACLEALSESVSSSMPAVSRSLLAFFR